MAVTMLLVLALASMQAGVANSLGLFFRTPWIHEVPQATFDAWFELIALGRAQGPSSPYYVEFLAIQNIACNQMYPIGPPCNASAPTTSKQALGNSSLPYGSIWEDDLAMLAKYFPLFDKVYVGTMWVDDWDVADRASNTRAAQQQAKVAARFLELYPNVPNMAWYITEEGSINDIGDTEAASLDMADFLNKTMAALNALRPLPVLWSPAITRGFGTYTAPKIAALQSNLEALFHAVSHPVRLHFQDFLGQSVTFQFPFFYNYSVALTCEGDTVPFYRLLQGVVLASPMLEEVKVNMEMFAERLTPAGEHGENNGANIINANPSEIAQRMSCYLHNGLDIGACWALPHWYYLWTYANATVYAPY